MGSLSPETKKWASCFQEAQDYIPYLVFELKLVAQCELHLTRHARRRSYLPERWQADISKRQCEFIIVECIIGFPTELQRMVLRPWQPEVLQD
jgi:hypothetical protein